VFRSIQRLRDFGVFVDLRKTATLQDFGAKNILYGWNYSGKTTLSRLFASIGSGIAYPDCPGATFQVDTSTGHSVTHTTLTPPQWKVAVFNSDFIRQNLSWDGGDFQSILLLGDDAIEAQKEIERQTRMLGRRHRYSADALTAVAAVDTRIAEARTALAKSIKTTLGIVESFTAANLPALLAKLPVSPSDAVLSAEELAADIKTALTQQRDMPANVGTLVPPTLHIEAFVDEMQPLMSHVPAVSELIDYLRDHPAVSRWVEDGLTLHAGLSHCEFCGGQLTDERLERLKGHFSKDLAEHRNALNALIGRIKASAISTIWLTPAQFTTTFQQEAQSSEERLAEVCRAYNDELDRLITALATKRENPFEQINPTVVASSVAPALTESFEAAAALIARNNESIGNFPTEKGDAVQRVKMHFIAQFVTDENQAALKTRTERLRELETTANTSAARLKASIQALNAKIDRAQKGRERLNERIEQLLGTGVIQIEVVPTEDESRFALRRQGHPAKNLSDGERTAIAFAFFLTKLEEHPNLAEVIVYIDDPISSLDSNHVFQVYAIIEATFFRKVDQPKGDSKWSTSCAQLFISTHNFEFLEMLKKLPIKNEKTADGARYFMVKRTGPETSTLVDLPLSLHKHSSEYHYLFSVIHEFVEHPTKDDVGQLLALPNVLRRFVELYTYMRLPEAGSTVDIRLAALVGTEKSHRITKLLHHFSHLETVDRLASHTEVLADIEAVVDEVMDLLRTDGAHLNALMQGIPPKPEPVVAQ
jgi:wobble nucleotide-excising tRNase